MIVGENHNEIKYYRFQLFLLTEFKFSTRNYYFNNTYILSFVRVIKQNTSFLIIIMLRKNIHLVIFY